MPSSFNSLLDKISSTSRNRSDNPWDNKAVRKFLKHQRESQGSAFKEADLYDQITARPRHVESKEARMLFFACFLVIVDTEYNERAYSMAKELNEKPYILDLDLEEEVLRKACEPVRFYFIYTERSIIDEQRLFESDTPREKDMFNRAAIIAQYFSQCSVIRKVILRQKLEEKPITQKLESEIAKLKREREPFKKVIADIMSSRDADKLRSDFQKLRETVPALKNADFEFNDRMTAFEMLEVLEEAWEREFRKYD